MNDSFNYIPNTQDAQDGRTIYFDINVVFKRSGTEMLKEFKRTGHQIGVIATEPEDAEWLKKHGLSPYIDSLQFMSRSASMYEIAKDKTGILVSDDDKVLNTWFSDRIKIIK